jgi:hypothetical protein
MQLEFASDFLRSSPVIVQAAVKQNVKARRFEAYNRFSKRYEFANRSERRVASLLAKGF